MRLNTIIEKLYAHLFFLLFSAQILSPSINDKTIYLEVILVLLNPFFIYWMAKKKINNNLIYIFVGLIFILATLKVTLFVKLCTTMLLVFFLIYARNKEIFYLKQYLVISTFFAITQFIFLFIDPSISRLLGPDSISNVIWGKYATATFSNFHTIFWIPRVSGLSREAGFFSAILLTAILYYYLDAKNSNKKLSLFYKVFFCIGYILSFSKVSLLILPVFLVEKYKLLIKKIPFFITFLSFVIFMMVFWTINKEFISSNATFMHRFSAYISLNYLNFEQVLFGVSRVSELSDNFSNLMINYFHYDEFAGFGGFIIHNGLITTFVFLFTLWVSRVSSAGVLILLLLTINVQPSTNQNFVVMAYYIIYLFYNRSFYNIS